MGVKQYAEKGDSRVHIELCRDISSLNNIVVFPFYKMAITVRDDIESTPSRHLALTMAAHGRKWFSWEKEEIEIRILVGAS